jgi:hypothetical protein
MTPAGEKLRLNPELLRVTNSQNFPLIEKYRVPPNFKIKKG